MTGILIGERAPNFTSAAVLPDGTIQSNFELHESIKGKYGLIFFYPLDFTFVCPSELIALGNRYDALVDLNVQIITVSTDSPHAHRAWRNTELVDGGIGQVPFIMASDLEGEIVTSYGIRPIPNNSFYDSGVAMRATFITDRNLVIRSLSINDEPIGRNIDEHIRTVEALQFFEENGEVCPAGWNKGKPGMQNTAEGVSKYLEDNYESL